MNEYPEELLVPPAPLVAVLSDGAFLPKLVESLRSCTSTNSTASGVSLRYEPFGLSLPFPKKERSHGQDYGSYVPAGILRSNWLRKHADGVPALLVLAWPLNLRAPAAEWAGREQALVTAVLTMKQFARGRGQDVHVVLVNEGPLPSGRSMMGDDFADILLSRITAVRRNGGLDGNAVTLVTDADAGNDRSVLLRDLDNVLRDRALDFYKAQCKRLKAILDKSVRGPGAAGLRARLLFKLGHYKEHRGKHKGGLKYFGMCAAVLQSMPATCPPALISEVKAVADLVNFKLVHGYLASGLDNVKTHAGVVIPGAQAALMVFNSHMRAFEGCLSPEERARPWQHWSWMSRQYVVVAELLQLNLLRPSAETKPAFIPSHYYHTAALMSGKRRKAAEAAGVIPALHVAPSVSNGVGALLVNVTGQVECSAHAQGAMQGLLGQAGMPETPLVSAARAELLKWAQAPPKYVGSPVLVAPLGAGQALSSSEAAPILTAASIVAEARFGHTENIVQLLEKAQAISLIDGGSGSRSLSAGLGQAEKDALYYSRGSNFTYEVAPDCSRSRLWRQWLLAEEVWATGEAGAATRLLLPVAERYRCERAWPLLARVLGRLRECALVTGDVALFVAVTLELCETAQHCPIPGKLEAIQAHLAAVLRAYPAGSGGGGAGGALVTLPLPAPAPLTPDADDAKASFCRTPGPARATAALRKPNAPLISAVVAFSNRCAHRGRRVRVRVILTSGLPRPMLAEAVHVTFAHAHGDFALRIEGQGAELAKPLLSGMRHLGGASPFDIVVRHGPLPQGASTEDGVVNLPALTQPKGRTGQPLMPRELTLPLLLPARASIAFEYDVELPGLDEEAGEGGGGVDSVYSHVVRAATSPLPADAALEDAVQAAGAGAAAVLGGEVSVEGHSSSKYDTCCTDPATMVTALSGTSPAKPDAASGHTISAWDVRSETVLPQSIVVCWRGREDETEVAAGGEVRLDLLPRSFGTAGTLHRHLTSTETRPVAPGLSLSPVDSLLSCLTQHRVPPAMSLAEGLTAGVAHMVRTGAGLGGGRGVVGAFAPGTSGIGFADGDMAHPSSSASVMAVADADAVAQVAAASTRHTAAPGASVHAATALTAQEAASLPPAFLSHEMDGACCGKPLPYHSMLLILAPDAHVTITAGNGWRARSAAASGVATTHTAAVVMGAASPVALTVSAGRRGMLGGVLKLASACAGVVATSSVSAAVPRPGSGMADVSLGDAAAVTAAGLGSTSTVEGVDTIAAPSSVAQVLVHPDTLVVTGEGKQVAARDAGCSSVGCLVLLSSAVVGVALPALAPGVAFSFVAHVLAPSTAAGVSSPGAPTAVVSLRCEAHVTEDDGMGAVVEGSSWLDALRSQPTLHRTLEVDFVLPGYPAVSVRATVLPDPSAPLLDLGPLLLPLHGSQRPWTGAGRGWDKGVGLPVLSPGTAALSSATEGPAYSLTPHPGAVGHVRLGSKFTLLVELIANPVAQVLLSAVSILAAPASDASSTGGLHVLTSTEELAQQLGLTGASVGSGVVGTGLAAALARALAGADRSLLLEPSRSVVASLAVEATGAGLHAPPVGLRCDAVIPGGQPGARSSSSVVLALPPLAVHDPAVRCSVVYPSSPRVGEKTALSLQLINASAHFHAIEVTASPPPALPAHSGLSSGRTGLVRAPGTPQRTGAAQTPLGSPPAGGGAGGGALQPVGGAQGGAVPPGVLPVPSMELTGYSRFIVELLPGATKTVTFTLLPHAAGHVALPLVSLRASTGSKVATPAAQPLTAGQAGGAGQPLDRRVSPANDLLLTLCASSQGGGASALGRRASRVAGTRGAGAGEASPSAHTVPLTVFVH